MRRGARGLLLTASIWTAIAAFTVFVVPGAAMAETRVCATATLDEPFVMPGGAEHPPGKLTLCRSANYTPSRAIHVGYIDRRPISMLFSVRGRSEAPTVTEPYMMFSRDRAGRLRLYGFAAPSQDGMETFLFYV